MEPQNETVRQFLPVIKEKIAQDCEISDDDDDEDRTENAGSDDVDSDDSSAEVVFAANELGTFLMGRFIVDFHCTIDTMSRLK